MCCKHNAFCEILREGNHPVRGQRGKLIFLLSENKSKETYGQSRGLSNLEMEHVSKLAITGALLKAVKTSCVCTMQGRTYFI